MENINKNSGMLWVAGVVLFLAVAGGWGIAKWQQSSSITPAIDVIQSSDLGPVSDFKLISQAGTAFGLQDLKGKVWVVSFVYSSCKSSCPMLGQQMKRLQTLVPAQKNFRLISITVDPKKDNPQELAAYAKSLGAEEGRWFFLTGTKKEIARLAYEVFKVPGEPGVRRNVPGAKTYEVLHSNDLILVDAQGHIRGYFDGTLSEEMEKLKQNIQSLLKEKS